MTNTEENRTFPTVPTQSAQTEDIGVHTVSPNEEVIPTASLASAAPAEDISKTSVKSKAAAKTVKRPCRFLKIPNDTLKKNIIRGEKYPWLTARLKTIFWYLVNETNLSKVFDEDGRQYIEVSEREIAFLSHTSRDTAIRDVCLLRKEGLIKTQRLKSGTLRIYITDFKSVINWRDKGDGRHHLEVPFYFLRSEDEKIHSMTINQVMVLCMVMDRNKLSAKNPQYYSQERGSCFTKWQERDFLTALGEKDIRTVRRIFDELSDYLEVEETEYYNEIRVYLKSVPTAEAPSHTPKCHRRKCQKKHENADWADAKMQTHTI